MDQISFSALTLTTHKTKLFPVSMSKSQKTQDISILEPFLSFLVPAQKNLILFLSKFTVNHILTSLTLHRISTARLRSKKVSISSAASTILTGMEKEALKSNGPSAIPLGSTQISHLWYTRHMAITSTNLGVTLRLESLFYTSEININLIFKETCI